MLLGVGLINCVIIINVCACENYHVMFNLGGGYMYMCTKQNSILLSS